MAPMSEDTGRRLLAALEELLAAEREGHALQHELVEVVRPSFAGHWGNTVMAFGGCWRPGRLAVPHGVLRVADPQAGLGASANRV
jgi:hypothetical protein